MLVDEELDCNFFLMEKAFVRKVIYLFIKFSSCYVEFPKMSSVDLNSN